MSDIRPSPNPEIFRRLTEADFDSQITEMCHSREPIAMAVHGLFDDIESVVLPVPETATIDSEKASALGELALASGFYNTNIADSGIDAEWTHKFEIPISGINQKLTLEKVVTVTTKTKVHGLTGEGQTTGPHDELWDAIMIAKHNWFSKVAERSPWVTRRSTLLDVDGVRTGSVRRLYTYETDETVSALRQRIGIRLLAMPQLAVVSTTYLHSWYGLSTNENVLQVATAQFPQYHDYETTPPELLPVRFRALGKLLQYKADK